MDKNRTLKKRYRFEYITSERYQNIGETKRQLKERFNEHRRPVDEQVRGTQRHLSENICSEDDLRSRICGTFVVKFLACLPLLGFSNI